MNSETIAEILKDRWLDMSDGASWCEVDETHAYCCIRPEAILHTDVIGMLFRINDRTYEVCLFDRVCPAEGEDWLLVYAHPREDKVEDMTEEEWHELYGDSLDQGGDRGASHDLRVPSQVAARKQ
jgi:hypothetical protein